MCSNQFSAHQTHKAMQTHSGTQRTRPTHSHGHVRLNARRWREIEASLIPAGAIPVDCGSPQVSTVHLRPVIPLLFNLHAGSPLNPGSNSTAREMGRLTESRVLELSNMPNPLTPPPPSSLLHPPTNTVVTRLRTVF